MNRYRLPDLTYDFGALEPHISGRVMELHHGKHHAAYVKSANAVLEELDEARDRQDFKRLASLERSSAFNLSGHVLHSFLWKNLMPKGGGIPDANLAAAMKNDLGGFGHFPSQMTEAASTIMGSGWAALVWEPVGQRLLITQIYDHQSNVARPAFHSWSLMPGSMTTICSTRIARGSFSRPYGTFGTGRTLQPVMRLRSS